MSNLTMSNRTTSNQATTADRDSFYQEVMRIGNLRTPDHAERWTLAVLRTLGFNLSGSTKKELAKALPEELARDLTRGWRLINIRRSKLSLDDFAKDIALRSGNTDREVAKVVTQVVFRQLKSLVGDRVVRDVARDLSPEVGAHWEAA